MKKLAYLVLIVLLFSHCDKDDDPVITIEKPTGLTALYLPGQVDLSWTDNSDNETGFEVHRSEDSLTGYLLLKELDENIENCTDSTVEFDTKYFYKVRAVKDIEYSEFSNITSVNIESAPVLAPSELCAVYTGAYGELTWTDNSDDEKGFEVHRSTDSLTGYVLVKELDENIEIYLDSAAELGIKYFYKLRAVRDENFSDFSNIASAGRNFTFGSVTDYEGNIYKTIQIGDQVWMAENLKSKYYSDGSPLVDGTGVGNITGDSTEYYFSYDDDPVMAEIYGYLYPWAAAMRGAASSNSNPSGVQGVCPGGWHLPSKAECEELVEYLGGESIAGGKMKMEGNYYWDYNVGATNESGFSAIAGGHRGIVGYHGIGGSAEFKTATEQVFATRVGGYKFELDDYQTSTYISSLAKEVSYSVRCVKD